jgi:hypothetical protein
VGIFGSGYSYCGSSPRVTSETIGRDINPLGRGDGMAYVGGMQNLGRIAPMLPGSTAKFGNGNSINNDGAQGPSKPGDPPPMDCDEASQHKCCCSVVGFERISADPGDSCVLELDQRDYTCDEWFRIKCQQAACLKKNGTLSCSTCPCEGGGTGPGGDGPLGGGGGPNCPGCNGDPVFKGDAGFPGEAYGLGSQRGGGGVGGYGGGMYFPGAGTASLMAATANRVYAPAEADSDCGPVGPSLDTTRRFGNRLELCCSCCHCTCDCGKVKDAITRMKDFYDQYDLWVSVGLFVIGACFIMLNVTTMGLAMLLASLFIAYAGILGSAAYERGVLVGRARQCYDCVANCMGNNGQTLRDEFAASLLSEAPGILLWFGKLLPNAKLPRGPKPPIPPEFWDSPWLEWGLAAQLVSRQIYLTIIRLMII